MNLTWRLSGLLALSKPAECLWRDQRGTSYGEKWRSPLQSDPGCRCPGLQVHPESERRHRSALRLVPDRIRCQRRDRRESAVCDGRTSSVCAWGNAKSRGWLMAGGRWALPLDRWSGCDRYAGQGAQGRRACMMTNWSNRANHRGRYVPGKCPESSDDFDFVGIGTLRASRPLSVIR